MPFDIKTDLRIQYEKPAGTWNSVQADSFEVNIDRGIDIEQSVLARPNVGVAEVRLMKSSLSDLLSGPDYASNQRFRIQYLSAGLWDSVFEGFIQNIEMQYIVEAKQLEITITAQDMNRIALNTQIAVFTVPSGSGRSYKSLMNQLGTAITGIDSRYSQAQTLSGGSTTFQYAQDYLEISSGELFEKFLDAELGWLYSTRNSGMRYLTSSDVDTIAGYPFDPLNLTVSNVHSTSNLHVCMENINLGYVSDGIANQVKVTSPVTGISTTVTNSASVSAYGRQTAFFDIEFQPTTGSTYATWATEVSNAANPRSIRSVNAKVIRPDGNVSDVLQEDIGQSLQVKFDSIEERYIISRMVHNITPDHWDLSIGLWRGI